MTDTPTIHPDHLIDALVRARKEETLLANESTRRTYELGKAWGAVQALAHLWAKAIEADTHDYPGTGQILATVDRLIEAEGKQA